MGPPGPRREARNEEIVMAIGSRGGGGGGGESESARRFCGGGGGDRQREVREVVTGALSRIIFVGLWRGTDETRSGSD